MANNKTTDLRPYMRLGTDIVECLRWCRWRSAGGAYQSNYDLHSIEAERLNAAAEIERLRAENEELRLKLIEEEGICLIANHKRPKTR
jgi:hypothetical protein